MGKAVKSAGIGSILGGPGIGATAGGAQLATGLSPADILFGEKTGSGFARLDPDVAKTQGQARKLQRTGMARLRELGKEDPSKIAKRQVEQNVKAQRQSLADTRRRLQANIARRGLGSSSLGLAQQTGLDRATAQAITGERASLADRIRQARLGQAQSLIGGGNQVLGRPGAIRQFKTGGRTGGIAPLIGAGVGAAMGGADGARVGMGAGQYANSGIGQMV